MNLLEMVDKEQMKSNIPAFRPGDTVKVHAKVRERGKERIQVFEGVVIRRKRGGKNAPHFTVKKCRLALELNEFSRYSPNIDKIEVIRYGKVRRSKLYYLRKKRGKEARIKERRVWESKR